jgi:hypothetical protein
MFEKSQDYRLKVWLNNAEWAALQAMAAAKGISVPQTVREYIHKNAPKASK